MDSNTDGGAHIGGDASAGQDFTGRDYRTDKSRDSSINIKLGDGQISQHDREGQSLHKRVQDMERYLYGDHRAGEPGLIMRTRTQLRWSQVNTGILIIILFLLMFRFTV